jgi:S-formylglutathione hydrolase FrmB
VPGPNSWVFLSLLVCGAVALMFCMIRSHRLLVKATASVLAFGVSALFGVGLVNSFYDYYTSWSSLYDDMTNSGTVGYQAAGLAKPQLLTVKSFGQSHTMETPRAQPSFSASPSPVVSATIRIPDLKLTGVADAGTGRLVRLHLPGVASRIDRLGYVYLPPQYFEPAYAHVRFPVLELLHGDPGDPTNWIYGLRLPDVMDAGIHAGRVGPMVIVMPATFSGKHGNDCANAAHGEQDDTYLSRDVPADIVEDFRVLPLGPNWGIGGLSDGGFCAANLALRHRGSYGAVASMDGFYSADADLGVLGADFGNNASLLAANDPTDEVAVSTQPLPYFWIMAGTGNGADFQAAQTFRAVLQSREPVRSVVLLGGKHAPPAWRTVFPDLLQWMWSALSGRPVPSGTVTAKPASQTQKAPLVRPSANA